MSCSSYLLCPYHWCGAKWPAVVTQSLVKEHGQEWATGTCSPPSSLSQVSALASSSSLPVCCLEPAQEPLQLCAPHHTGAIFKEISVLIKWEATDVWGFFKQLFFPNHVPHAVCFCHRLCDTGNGCPVWAVAHDFLMLYTFWKWEMLPLSST